MDYVWVVFDYDTNPYPIMIFKQEDEIEAHRFTEELGYGHVKKWSFEKLWTELGR